MQRQQFLFDPLVELNPDHIMSIVGPALPRLRGLVRDHFDKLQAYRQREEDFAMMNEGQSAWWMATQLENHSRANFHGEPMLEFRRAKQQNFIVVCEEAVVVYKKLRLKTNRDGHTELVTSNYKTRQNMDWWTQQEIEGVPQLPRVILGYEFRHELTEMRCYLGLPRGSNAALQWHREIDSPQGFEDGFTDEHIFEVQPTEEFGFEIEELDEQESERTG